MTEIDKAKAVLAVCANPGIALSASDRVQIANSLRAMIAKAEQADEFEAYKREVSDAVELVIDDCGHDCFHKVYIHSRLARYILPKPVDPLEVLLAEAGYAVFPDDLEKVRAALAKRGLKIVECEG